MLKDILFTDKNEGFLYLHDTGWLLSRSLSLSVDAKGNPIPWVTYPFISFIKTRLNKSMKIFEFGTGQSTLFYSKLVGKVVSLECKRNWWENYLPKVPTNVIYLLEENSDIYPKVIHNTIDDNKILYDMIIVDSIKRNECFINSLECLSNSGVIVLDDSQRDNCQKIIHLALSLGFRHLPFFGHTPLEDREKCTSVFYRNNNCLGI